jgi:hypothetical protein
LLALQIDALIVGMAYLQGGTGMGEQDAARTAARYIRFAEEEAQCRSPLYERIARGVAADAETMDFLLRLPEEKRQPNLLLAAVRHVFGAQADWPAFRRALLTDPEAVRSILLTHSTQTNEPARCATLLPVLARLPQPLALIEVGASAGLCLLPDLYGYDYEHRSIRPLATNDQFPIFACSTNEATPLPDAMPHVVWRAGLDVNPLDASDPSQAAWLENLVWPEQTDRLHRLRTALKVAAASKPWVMKGSLLGDDLARLCDEAPKDATLVVFHSAVLAYIAGRAARQAFAEQVKSLCQFWISNESPRVFPDIAGRAEAGGQAGRFLLSVNGLPVAWTDPHGASIEWIAGQIRAAD